MSVHMHARVFIVVVVVVVVVIVVVLFFKPRWPFRQLADWTAATQPFLAFISDLTHFLFSNVFIQCALIL